MCMGSQVVQLSHSIRFEGPSLTLQYSRLRFCNYVINKFYIYRLILGLRVHTYILFLHYEHLMSLNFVNVQYLKSQSFCCLFMRVVP